MIHKKEMTSVMKTKTILRKRMNLLFIAKNFEEISKLKGNILNELSNVRYTEIETQRERERERERELV